jgi:hypothetical protein
VVREQAQSKQTRTGPGGRRIRKKKKKKKQNNKKKSTKTTDRYHRASRPTDSVA